MPINYNDIRKNVLKDVAENMCVAARTAPKTRGIDNLVIAILTDTEKTQAIAAMKKIGERDSRPSFIRDAENIRDADYIAVIGTKKTVLGLNCGFCGYPSCDELARTKSVCSYNSMDLGIALGSAVSLAARSHIDNRIMFSIGKTVVELGLLGADVIQAIGIPLTATGKNPFFDRK